MTLPLPTTLCGVGKLLQLRSCWDNIVVNGPHLAYYPRADKCWLIVKPHLEETAKKFMLEPMFAFQPMGTNILVDTSARRREKLSMSDLWLRGGTTRFMY